MEDYVLSNGVRIPKMGFGCYKLDKSQIRSILKDALDAGYTHFDTATFYGNEAEMGDAFASLGVDRKSLFITTKVWKTDLSRVEQSLDESLKKLRTDYVDLFLVHWPRPDLQSDWRTLDAEAWAAVEKLYAAGKARAVGVSNFLPHHLMNLYKSCTVRPMVDQLEFHPGYTQEATVNYCEENDIVVEAWSPLGRGRLRDDVLLRELSAKYGVSIQQLCLQFAMQCHVLPIPKASSRERMEQNIAVAMASSLFSISEEDMFRLHTMPQAGWSGEHPDRDAVERQQS